MVALSKPSDARSPGGQGSSRFTSAPGGRFPFLAPGRDLRFHLFDFLLGLEISPIRDTSTAATISRTMIKK